MYATNFLKIPQVDPRKKHRKTYHHVSSNNMHVYYIYIYMCVCVLFSPYVLFYIISSVRVWPRAYPSAWPPMLWWRWWNWPSSETRGRRRRRRPERRRSFWMFWGGADVQFESNKWFGYGSIPIDTFLVGWTSIYQLFWGSLGTRVLTHPHLWTICGQYDNIN